MPTDPIFENMDRKLGDHLVKLTGIDARLGQQTTELGDIASRLGQQTTTLGGIDAKLGQQATALGSIDAKMGQQTAELGSLGAQLGEQTKSLGGIGGQLGEQIKRLDNINATLGTQAQSLGGISSQLGDQTKSLGSIDSRLGQQTATLSSIDAGLDKLSGALAPSAALALGMRGADVQELHVALGKLGFVIPQSELDEQLFGAGTQDAVRAFQIQHKVAISGVADHATQTALATATAGLEVKHSVEGRIYLDHGLPAGGVTLRLYSRGFGGVDTRLGEVTTDDRGYYTLHYSPGVAAVNLQVRVVGVDGSEAPLCAVKFNAERHEVMNLVAPASVRPLAAEYQRLAAALEQQVGGLDKLAGASESADRQDLTLLHRATGWDARLIALAAMTERLCADPQVNLPKAAVYGLLRAGLPSDKLLLSQVAPETAEKALKKVRDAGIVALSDEQISQVKQNFTTFSNAVRLDLTPPGSRSSYRDLIGASGLPQDAQDKFAPIYLNHSGGAAQLWNKALEAGLTDPQVKTLQLQGKLAFLAGNSAGMIGRLMQKQVNGKAINDPAQLVDQDLHRPEVWADEILSQAGIPAGHLDNLTDAEKKQLDAVIPPVYVADKTQVRLQIYAQDMARKMRLSYPTQVVRRLMETDDKYQLPEAHASTFTLLKNATDKGFRLGQTPVTNFIKAHPEIMAAIPSQETRIALQQFGALSRLYQITPDNESIPVLKSLGITSAYDVMAYSEEQFVQLYNAKYLETYYTIAAVDMASLIYRKATQVSSVTYNLFAIAKQMDSTPAMPATSPSPKEKNTIRNELIKHYPTMESLFGSMDYCECEHCRSVLSPAAYLVDLLQFVDIEPGVWANFQAQWKATHNDQGYPHKDSKGNAMKPYDVLVERRPDLANIQLTCENTNTALPYIDIVNEIMEYYVAHNGNLAPEAAHDTGEATTAELLAEPQNVIREAYETLRGARYPLNLPFDLWVETVRQFCNYFEAPLDRVLETFRPGDELFVPGQAYDRAGIFLEGLGLSPAEAAVLADPAPLDKWYELYGYDSEEEAKTPVTDAATGQRIDLNSAKALSRRLGVTYKEIVEIVQTCFVNSKLAELVLLYKLGVAIRDARFYQNSKLFYEQNQDLLGKDRSSLSAADRQRYDDLDKPRPNSQKTGWDILNEVSAFVKRLDDLAAEYQMQADDLRAYVAHIPFGQILVLADPDAGCNFDETTLQYADGAAADNIAYLRINLFVRLWCKLGWSIEEIDRALTSFIPHSAPYDGTAANLSKQPLKTALIYLAHLKALDAQVKVGKPSRLKLLALWSDIATTGKKPLYAQLFLSGNILKTDPVFDHPMGKYLQYLDSADGTYKPFHWDPAQAENPATGNVSLKSHLLTVQGALSVTSEEISRILAEARDLPSKDAAAILEQEPLTLETVSLIYRYGLLAKALDLPVRDLITLKQLSGLNPFKALCPDPLAAIADDYPFSQTLRFVEVAGQVKASGLTMQDLDYVLRHRFDETGTYRPNREGTLAWLKTLSAGIRAIRALHAMPADPGALTEEVLKQELGLALPAEAAGKFMAMMNGTAEFTASRSGVAQADQLTPEGFAGEAAIREVRYNAVRQEQKLTFRGVLLDAEKAALEARLPKPVSPNPHVASPVLKALLDDVQNQARAFFDKHLKKQAPNVQPAYGFLEDADYEVLFVPVPDGWTEEEKQKRRKDQLARLAQAFFQYLQARLIRQLIVQSLTAYTAADPVLVESLVADERMLWGTGGKPLLASFEAAGLRGVSAAFFDSDDLSGGPQAARPVVDSADVALKDQRDEQGNSLKPANSARFTGYLEVPAPGAYRFYIELEKPGATAELRFDHLPDPLFMSGGAASKFLELEPGLLYSFTLELKQLSGGGARLLVQGETLPKDQLSQLALYPLDAISGAENAACLLTKSLKIASSLGLGEREIRYLLTHAPAFDNLSFSQLPTQPVGDTPAEKSAAVGRFNQFLRLAAYVRLKGDLAASTDDLVDILEANEVGDLKQSCLLIAKLTRREPDAVQAAAEKLGQTAFSSERPLQRLWEGLQIVERFGAPAASLASWTRIVDPNAPPDQRYNIAHDLRQAIKARYEPETWQRVAQPIFDRLRQRQRDALVSYIMRKNHFDRMEQLYEYFLIDPGMEPVVQTSRIRLAIASVQLFIQRCLLNLEPKVHPTAIVNARHWEWMKRYRVWEANRKIFLFPENWLEPEFRDDKTHLFAELEGALLQGDVSTDLVEDAFFRYLKKLDELARLDIVAMHIEDNPDPARRVLHVFGRTFSQPHSYFYRHFAHQMWAPWEPVSAEIEGDHLAPVVWRDRLYLFWVTFMDKPDRAGQTGTRTASQTLGNVHISDVVSDLRDAGGTKRIDVQLHWSEYLNGEWSTRQSGSLTPVTFLSESNITVEAGPNKRTYSTSFILPLQVPLDFDPKSVFVHVSKTYKGGEERGVFIHLRSDVIDTTNDNKAVDQSFYLAGRNSAPERRDNDEEPPWTDTPANPYTTRTQCATRYSGSGALRVTYHKHLTTEPGQASIPEHDTPSILQQWNGYVLLPCDNNLLALGVSEEAYTQATNPAAVKDALESGLGEIAALIKPVFYQDKANTFFVQPSVTEKAIEKWEHYVTQSPISDDTVQVHPYWVDVIAVEQQEPRIPGPDPGDPWAGRYPVIDPLATINPVQKQDWLVNAGTLLVFDEVLVGPKGAPGLAVQPVVGSVGATLTPAVNVSLGSSVATGSRVVVSDAATFKQSSLAQASGGYSVVGQAGFNSALDMNYSQMIRSNLGAMTSGAAQTGR